MANPHFIENNLSEFFSALERCSDLPPQIRTTFRVQRTGWLVDETFVETLGRYLFQLSPEITEMLYAISGNPSVGCTECEVLANMERRTAIETALGILKKQIEVEGTEVTV